MALRSGRVGIHPSQVDPITGMLLNGPTPGSISFEDLSDAQIANPEAGQTLIYNGTGWENEFSSISPNTLSALQDVQITEPEDGDYLMYDSANSKWINSGEAPAPTYTDLTVTMYGAVEDTISFTDAAGISHTEVFASGQSSKSVTFKINSSGSTSITFTSAVAKNPDNLTADYSKTVTITDATTEIKVMPDNSLYWWGYENNLEDISTANGWTLWGAGRAWETPTYNTNNIIISPTINARDSGVGSVNAIRTTNLYAVANNSSGNAFARIGLTTSKQSNQPTETGFTVTGLHTYSLSDAGTSDKYVMAFEATNASTVTLYALWYE